MTSQWSAFPVLFFLFALFLASPLEGHNPPEKDRPSYTLAVLPQFPPVEIHKRWMPFVERLSKELGVGIQLKVYKAVQQFEDDVRNGIPDIAYMNPYQATQAKKTVSYIPLIRDKKPIKGVVVVNKDSPFRSLLDLNNKEIAFVSSKTICSIAISHDLLKGKENISFIPQYVGTASNVFRNVVLGKVPAGGTLNTPLDREPAEVREQLRVIYETMPMAPHPIVAHPRLPEELRNALINAVMKLSRDRNSHDALT